MTLTPRDKRMLQVLGVVAGLALIYLLFTTVLAGDDGGDVAAPTGPTATTGATPPPSASPSVTESPTPRETLPPVDLAGARDPFSIPPGLATSTPSGSVSPTSPPPGTTTPPPTGTTTPPPTTIPPTSPPPTTPPPPTSPPPTTPPPPTEPPPTDQVTIGGHELKLESINNNRKRLLIDVDHKLYTVEEGALFDENFKLVRIKGPCARFLFGDQSFELCLK
jgi:hypothetical protein